MSWDIVLFNSRQKIESVEEVDEHQLEPIDFCSILESHFERIVCCENHREIKGDDFVIDYFVDDENVAVKIVNLYGENGLYELVVLARANQWQLFDTGSGQMIDLDHPARNGYENFQRYLDHVMKEDHSADETAQNPDRPETNPSGNR